ncbi:MAG: S8 family serine peptidase [Nocardiaceae bacterium]|nr:S8 family serine peptidase [Nocardiaceae bacterium]
MRILSRGVLASVLAAAALAVVGAPPALAADSENVIVVYKDGVDVDQKTNALEQANQIRPVFRYRSAVHGFAAKVTPIAKARLLADRDVAFVSPDRQVNASEIGVGSVSGVVPSAAPDVSSAFSPGGAFGNTGGSTKVDTIPNGVLRIAASAPGNIRAGSGVGVAVIDTGISTGTGDLNVGNGVNCVRPGSSASDDNGHGTHVAGTIAATKNQSKVVGVAPGTKLYPVKVLDSKGNGSWSQVICGLDWVTANAQVLNIRVANLSLGGDGQSDDSCGTTNSDALHAAVCRVVGAGVTLVVAAGNSGKDLATESPASYPEVLTVTAMSDSDGKPGGVGRAPSCRTGEVDDGAALFSNYATAVRDMSHTVAAPGVCIESLATGWFSSTKVLSGTSMATPHVTGTVALCESRGTVPGPCANLTPAQVIEKIRADAAGQPVSFGFTGDPRSSAPGRYYGYLVSAGVY